jgi:serine/threonine protein kinase
LNRKCRNRKTGQNYAVKILSRHKHDATSEVKYLNKCQGHENIVKLYDVLQDDLHTYIIMELLTGGELFDRIRQRVQFTEREASIIMKSLISALQFIHSQGVVHRDLKPENIIFADASDHAKVKIVDFGFARLKPDQKQMRKAATDAAHALSTQGKFMLQTPCFTLPYAAPEVLKQALHTSAQTLGLESANSTSNGTNAARKTTMADTRANFGAGYDESCDLWSLGVILYTMLCGSVPFSSNESDDLCSSDEEEGTSSLKPPNKRRCAGQNLKNQPPATTHVNSTAATAQPASSSSQQSTASKPPQGLVTQEKIIERIRHASSSLTFDGKRWKNVSESGKQLLRGLLNIEPSKRMKLRDLCRHAWIKTLAGTSQSAANPLLTTKILNKHLSRLESRPAELVVIDEPNAAEVASHREALQTGNRSPKLTLRSQFNRAFEAFHAAEEKGLLTLQLKDVFDAPLAQRRHQKRSTSSNASSESNVSNNSICSSLSTSTTSVNTNLSSLQYSTPTKKCPSNCGKLGEPVLFTFNDSYVNEYLKQQQQQLQQHQQYATQTGQNQVFNRPITRSITHHNSKLNAPVFDFGAPAETGLNGDESKSSLNDSVDSSCVTSASGTAVNTNESADAIVNHNFCVPNLALYTNSAGESPAVSLGQPPCKRMKRCATILID